MRTVGVVLLLGILSFSSIAGLSTPTNCCAKATTHRLSASASAPLTAGSSAVVAYTSSVDGTALDYMEYLPAGYNPAVAYPLAILLPGSGGNLNQYDTAEWHQAADAHNYILATIHPRVLPGYGTLRMTFYMNGALVPGEQDVLDMIPAVQARHALDPARIYLAGYSMGGVGTLNIVTLNPGVFAAAAPGAPISDLFQEWDYSPNAPAPNFATLLSGTYGHSVITDTAWYENSPRFLLPNLMHTPLWIVHGTGDTVIPNATNTWPYMQSRHIVDTSGYTDSRGRAATLAELHAAWPAAYIESHIWPNATHGAASLDWLPNDVLTFFDAHPRIANPLTVAFSTYEDRHVRAYWLQLALTHPWTAQPGLVYVTRTPQTNSVQIQSAGSLTLTLDMASMELISGASLSATVSPIGQSPAGDLTVVFSGAWPTASGIIYQVKRDGSSVPASDYTVTPAQLTLRRQTTDATHNYQITVLTDTSGGFTSYLPAVVR